MASGNFEEEDYYHGLLPREDIPILLKFPGDYLLRTSQTKATEARTLILSLALAVEAKASKDGSHQDAPNPNPKSSGASARANTSLDTCPTLDSGKAKRKQQTRRTSVQPNAASKMRGVGSREGVGPAGRNLSRESKTVTGRNLSRESKIGTGRNLSRETKTKAGRAPSSMEPMDAAPVGGSGEKKQQPKVIVVDVEDSYFAVNDPKLPANAVIALRHYVIRRSKTPPGNWTIDGSVECESVGQLVEEYRSRKMPLNKGQAGTVLVNPVKRAAWELRQENVMMNVKLGEGAFGDVFCGKLRLLTGEEVDVAVKVARTEDMNKEKIKEVMKEARLMRNFDHPNVVKLWGVVVEKEPLMIVMELINGGGLDKHLKKGSQGLVTILTQDKIAYIQDAAWGIEYLHHKRVIHRDLAVRNCLLAEVPGSGPVVKISDFGLSREGEIYKLSQTRMVPIKWLAPEVMKTWCYSPKSDVWAFGVLAWEVFANGEEPYYPASNAEAKQKILKGELLNFPADTPPEIVTLITNECWEISPEKRSSMTAINKKLEAMTNRTPPCQQDSVRRSIVDKGSNGQPVQAADPSVPAAKKKGKSKKPAPRNLRSTPAENPARPVPRSGREKKK